MFLVQTQNRIKYNNFYSRHWHNFHNNKLSCRLDYSFSQESYKRDSRGTCTRRAYTCRQTRGQDDLYFEMQDPRLFFAGVPSSYINSCSPLRDIRNLARITTNMIRRFVPVGFACMQKLERATLPDRTVYELTSTLSQVRLKNKIHSTDTQTSRGRLSILRHFVY